MRSLLYAISAWGLMNWPNTKERTSIDDIDLTPKTPPIPKGCKKYVFSGDNGSVEIIAMNEKSAIKKHEKLTMKKLNPNQQP